MLKAAQRRYVWRVGVAMTAFLATLFLADYWVDDRGLIGVPAAMLALLPGICAASVFWAIGRFFLDQEDEYQRMLLVRQLVIAGGISMSAMTIWGYLADFGIAAAPGGFYPLSIFFVGLGIGAIVNRLAFGEAGA